jgi:minimal PKS acyl carrier protein
MSSDIPPRLQRGRRLWPEYRTDGRNLVAGFTLTEFRRVVAASLQDVEGALVLTDADLDTPLDELGIDSLTVVDLTAQIQDEYGVHITDEDLATLKTPRSLVDYADARMPTSSGG